MAPVSKKSPTQPIVIDKKDLERLVELAENAWGSQRNNGNISDDESRNDRDIIDRVNRQIEEA